MYRKATPQGGVLIRRVLKTLRDLPDFKRATDSHILIALSAGSDSTALAHLLVHHGRKLVPPSQIILLYIDHGWRKGSRQEADAVRRWAQAWGVRAVIKRLPPKFRPSALRRNGESLEAGARRGRKEIFANVAKHCGAKWVFTAHTADDVAETMLWRLASGGAELHGAVHLKYGIEVRPLLDVWKVELTQYLREVGQPWFEDPTNHEGKLLRSRIRKECWPALESVFPRIRQHLHRRARSSSAMV